MVESREVWVHGQLQVLGYADVHVWLYLLVYVVAHVHVQALLEIEVNVYSWVVE